MIFSEIYGAYYLCVSKILEKAVNGSITDKDIRHIAEKYAFSESLLAIEPALKKQKWTLLQPDGSTPIQHIPTIPPSTLEKMWLKAILLDKRIKLFDVRIDGLDNVEPLFTEDDYTIFDSYSDGDPYNDNHYIKNFRTVLSAVKSHRPLRIGIINKRGMLNEVSVIPEFLEYSEKDDKFRLITSGTKNNTTVNIGRILYCEPLNGNIPKHNNQKRNLCTVTLALTDERNALERVMLHFSHFEKEAAKIDDLHYIITIHYDSSDETELLIRILSFGAKLKVTSPESFITLIKKRLLLQKQNLSSNKSTAR